jgi:hypothetical protein
MTWEKKARLADD